MSGPLAARVLGVEDRGYLALLMIFPSILWQLGTMGMPFAIPFFLSENVSGPSFLRKVLPVWALQSIGLALVHLAIVLLFARSHEGRVAEAAWWTLLALPGMTSFRYALSILQGTKRLLAFNVFSVLPFASYAAALAVMFVTDVRSLSSVAIAWSLAHLLGGAAAAAHAVRVTAGFRREGIDPPARFPTMLVFGMKSLLGSVPPVESFRLDQALIGLLFTPSALGLYVVAFGYTNLPGFIGKGIGNVAYPHIATNRAVKPIWGFFFLNLLLSTPLAFGFYVVASSLVPLLFGDPFSEAVPLVGALFVESVLTSSRRILSDGMRGAGAPGAGTFSELAYLALLLMLTPLMISSGVIGFVRAMALSAGCSLALMIALAIRHGRRGQPSGHGHDETVAVAD